MVSKTTGCCCYAKLLWRPGRIGRSLLGGSLAAGALVATSAAAFGVGLDLALASRWPAASFELLGNTLAASFDGCGGVDGLAADGAGQLGGTLTDGAGHQVETTPRASGQLDGVVVTFSARSPRRPAAGCADGRASLRRRSQAVVEGGGQGDVGVDLLLTSSAGNLFLSSSRLAGTSGQLVETNFSDRSGPGRLRWRFGALTQRGDGLVELGEGQIAGADDCVEGWRVVMSNSLGPVPFTLSTHGPGCGPRCAYQWRRGWAVGVF